VKLVCRVDAATWAALDEQPLLLPVNEIEIRHEEETRTRRVRHIERLGGAVAPCPGVVLRTWSNPQEESA
jgi:hypothetical protein